MQIKSHLRRIDAGMIAMAVAAGCGTPTHKPNTNTAVDGSAANDLDDGAGTQSASSADAGDCKDTVGKWQSACSNDGYTMEDCESDRSRWLGQHCNKEWALYAGCAGSTVPDCQEGDFPSCQAQQVALFACQSAFVARTNCSRIQLDEQCSEAAPFALLCLGESPDKACVQRGEAAQGVNPVCCP